MAFVDAAIYVANGTPFVKIDQTSSLINLDCLFIEVAIKNENNILSFSNNPLLIFL